MEEELGVSWNPHGANEVKCKTKHNVKTAQTEKVTQFSKDSPPFHRISENDDCHRGCMVPKFLQVDLLTIYSSLNLPYRQ